jgi:hypothetical protein
MTAERRDELRELAAGWVRFIRFVELQHRIDAGGRLIHLVRPDAA